MFLLLFDTLLETKIELFIVVTSTVYFHVTTVNEQEFVVVERCLVSSLLSLCPVGYVVVVPVLLVAAFLNHWDLIRCCIRCCTIRFCD